MMNKYTMTTKHILAAGVLLSSALWSCTDDVDMPERPDPEEYITFGVPKMAMGGVETSDMSGSRGTVISGSLPEGDFLLAGYLKSTESDASSDWVTKYQLLDPDIISARNANIATIHYTGEVCWYTPLKEWDSNPDAKYTFFAYYPATQPNSTASGTSGWSKESPNQGVPRQTYNMPFETQTSIAESTALDTEVTIDAMYASKYDHLRSQGMVDFIFHHIHTAVRFKVNNFSDEPVKIRNLSLGGSFYASANVDFTPVAERTNELLQVNGGTYYNGTYNFWTGGEADPFEVPADRSLFVGDDTTEGTIVLLLAGNTVDTGNNLGNNVGFNCTFELDGEVKTVDPKKIINYNFEAGTLYNINLNFIGDSFTLNITTEDYWDNGSDNDIIIN